jgi:hypothetical protein
MSDAFAKDGDTSAAGLTVLHAAGYTQFQTHVVLQPFLDLGCVSYPGELQGSLSVAARILHALAVHGHNISMFIDNLCTQQLADGSWPRDKWNISWLYSAWHALLALTKAPQSTLVDDAIGRSIEAICRSQRTDGGWSPAGSSRMSDTVFAALALLAVRDRSWERVAAALRGARSWLSANIAGDMTPSWVAKDLYSPTRVDRMLAFSALFALQQHEDL